MRGVVLVVAVGWLEGCSFFMCHGSLQGANLMGGTGSITMDGARVFSPSGFDWMSGQTPSAGPNGADFVFRFSGSSSAAPMIYCSPDWSSLVNGPVSVTSACSVDGGDSTQTQALTEGTITATSALDSNGDGTVTITLDIPSQPFSIAATGDVGLVAASALRGTATFGDVPCNVGGPNLY